MTQTAEALREEAARLDRAVDESFQRCDTDGFLSQWALGLNAEKCRMQAKIEEHGGVWDFPALFDLEGNRVRARLIRVYCKFSHDYKSVWMLLDSNDQSKALVTAFPKRKSTMEKKGFREGREMAPAKATIQGSGHGLSGSAWVAIVRTDGGYPATAV